MIKRIEPKNSPQIVDIYNYFIVNTHYTFETLPITTKKMEQRIGDICSKYFGFIYEKNNIILGFAYACAWRDKEAYKYSLESTIYVKHDAHQRGIGTQLYKELLQETQKRRYHTIIGVIALPNDHSVALHRKLNFQHVGHLKEVGYKFNNYYDVCYWQKNLLNGYLQ